MTEVLITGGTGLLGPYVREASGLLGRARTCGSRSGDFIVDLTVKQNVAELIASARPDVVVHCAAMTDVDDCQTDPNRAMALNAGTVENLAESLPDKSRLIYISTDQVYPDTPGPHRENETQPLNIYGASKLRGEEMALRRDNSLVLRVNFFGPSKTLGRSSLSDWLVFSFSAGNPITLYTDSLFSPLHLETLAAAIVDATRAQLTGIFNLGCRDGMSKCDFSLAVAAHLGLPSDTATPGPSKLVATRAKDLRMDVSRIEKALGRAMPTLSREVARL